MGLKEDIALDVDIILSDLDPTVISIQRVAETPGDMSDRIEEWTTEFADVDCRFRPINGSEAIVWNKEVVTVSHVMYIKPIEITERDRVIGPGYGGGGFGEGPYGGRGEYDIVHVKDAHDIAHHLKVFLLERK